MKYKPPRNVCKTSEAMVKPIRTAETNEVYPNGYDALNLQEPSYQWTALLFWSVQEWQNIIQKDLRSIRRNDWQMVKDKSKKQIVKTISDIEKMSEWLMEEARTQPPPKGHAPRYGYRMERDTTLEQLKAMNETCPGIYGLEFAILPYPTKDYGTSNVMVSDGTRLRRLWLAVRYIANELDCQEAQATALILADKLPLLSALSAKTPQTFSKDKPSRGKIEITIREPIPEDELFRLTEISLQLVV